MGCARLFGQGVNWRINMLRKLLILMASLCMTQLVVADIATDIGDGVKVHPTTQNAKDADVIQEDAVVELIQAGIDCVVAVQSVSKIYGLTPLETDSVITAAISSSSICNTVPLVALYSTGSGVRLAVGPIGTQGIGNVGGSGGGSVSPN
jgi:hypothetical protein